MLKQITDFTIIETNDIKRIDIEFIVLCHNGNEHFDSRLEYGYEFVIKLRDGDTITMDCQIGDTDTKMYFDVFDSDSEKNLNYFRDTLAEYPDCMQVCESVRIKQILLNLFKNYILDKNINTPFQAYISEYIAKLDAGSELQILLAKQAPKIKDRFERKLKQLKAKGGKDD